MAALLGEGLVVLDSTQFIESIAGEALVDVNLRGRVVTLSGATVTVNKWLSVAKHHGRICVLTREYDYHAHARAQSVDQDLFRYDNCDGTVETLHRHSYDAGGGERLPKQPLAVADMPTLNTVIREAEFYAAWLLAQC